MTRALVVLGGLLSLVGILFFLFANTPESPGGPLGRSERERIEISGDVRDGDAVVTEGAFLLKTELSPESIGAGCCEVEPARGS